MKLKSSEILVGNIKEELFKIIVALSSHYLEDNKKNSTSNSFRI